MRFESDNWLSGRLGCDAFRLISGSSSDEQALPGGDGSSLAPGFYHAKVSTRDIALLRDLQARGFYVVDTNVTFERAPGLLGGPPSSGNVTVRNAAPRDTDEVLDIAATCFVYTRFHLDPQVSNEAANAIKREWIANYANGSRGEELLVAELDGKVAGFLAVLRGHSPAPGDRIIDLIGVAQDCQGRGVGKALVRHFVEASQGRCALLRVGTQVANIPSIRLYEQSGFRLAGSNYVLHAHVQREQDSE
jgi:ribosomal protein S18 acetylase RimI-like enzyme